MRGVLRSLLREDSLYIPTARKVAAIGTNLDTVDVDRCEPIGAVRDMICVRDPGRLLHQPLPQRAGPTAVQRRPFEPDFCRTVLHDVVLVKLRESGVVRARATRPEYCCAVGALAVRARLACPAAPESALRK